MSKTIKASDRGLTFSFNKTETFDIGTAVTYAVDLKNKKIIILPAQSENKKASVSRKKCGSEYKPLLDLRSKEVKELLAQAEYLNVEILGGQILVSAYVEDQSKSGEQHKQEKVIKLEDIIPVRKISSFLMDENLLKMAVGTETVSFDATGNIQSNVEGLNSYRSNAFSPNFKKDLSKVFKVISLFSGAGMFDYPFAKDKQFEIVYAVDNDKDAVESYKHNIGEHIECKSVYDVNGKELPKADLLIGGVVCTPFSNANRHTRLKDHSDSKLLNEYIRIVKESGVNAFVLENVPQILTACEGEYLQQILEEMKEFDITANIVCDSDVGGYTSRKRAIVCGSKFGKVDLPTILMKSVKTVKQALSKVTEDWFNYKDVTIPRKDTRLRMSCVPQGGNWKDIPEELRTNGCKVEKKHSHCYYRLNENSISPSIVNWRKPPLIHPVEDRTLTVAEASALSGFEKDFEFHGSLSSKQQQCGNGVPFALGKYVKDAIKKHLNQYINVVRYAW